MNSKPHYILLDALRGVAALIVLYYHLFEGYGYEIAEGSGIYTQVCDHGYLAVDFFFILSGFVIAYAYDDRLGTKTVTKTITKTKTGMSLMTFFKRRLIRLHPMVVLSVLIGVITFGIQGFAQWDFEGTGSPVRVGIGMVMVAMLLNMFMLPNIPGQPFEVRGNGELFPLNGPHWSLFFEYIGNVIYALFLCRVSTKVLAVVSAVSGILLGNLVLTSGYLGVGWTLPDFWTGTLRMLFPYTLGMLVARLYRSNTVQMPMQKYAFWVCSALLVMFLAVPFVGNPAQPWQNGLYIMLLITVLFPVIVWMAAKDSECEAVNKGMAKKLFTYLGELSYPLYAVHYPVMYLFFWYIGFPNVPKPMSEVWPVAVGVFVLNIIIATLALYLYDKPIRKWLSKKV